MSNTDTKNPWEFSSEYGEFEFPYGTEFVVTGKTFRSNRNFPAIRTTNLRHALMINLWRGNVWAIVGGKRKLIHSVWN